MRRCPLRFLLTLFLLGAAGCDASSPGTDNSGPIWGPTPPSVVEGAVSLDLTLDLARSASVSFSVYPSAHSLTAAEVRDDAAGTGGRSPLAAGMVPFGHGGRRLLTVDSLPAGGAWYLYVAGLPLPDDPAAPDSALVRTVSGVLHPVQPADTLQSPTMAGAIGYYRYAPERYYRDSLAPLPLLVFLHGSAEKGNGTTELGRVLSHGPPRLVAQGWRLPFLLVSPQLPTTSGGWPPALVKELIDSTRAHFAVDTTRVYVTGLSMGGYGTWAFAVAYPQIPAAVVPIAGAGSTGSACSMRNVPVWAFHGDADSTVNVSASINMVNAILACSPPAAVAPKLTIYPGVGHDSWTRTYDGSAGHDIYGWMLGYHR